MLKLPNHWTNVYMDNLFNTLNLYTAVYLAETLCHRVCRLNNTGISPDVVQKHEKNPRLADKICGQTRAVVLIDDNTCPNLLASSVYDQKHVTVLSMIAESITWDVNTRKVYSHLAGRNVDMDYLQLNIIDNYSNNINLVDLADQMNNYYCFDHWFRNQKW